MGTTRTIPGAGITGTETAVPGITVTAGMEMVTIIPGILETTEIQATAAMERGMGIQGILETLEIMAIPATTEMEITRKTARAKARMMQATATQPTLRSITARTRAASCSL